MEERIDALERKVHKPPVDENLVRVIHPVVVEDRGSEIRIEEVNPVTLNESRLYKRPVWEKPKLDLADVLKPDEPAPKISMGGHGVNLD